MVRTLRISLLTSLTLTALALGSFALVSASSASLPIEWAGAAPTERVSETTLAHLR
jgi:hypothetical protein